MKIIERAKAIDAIKEVDVPWYVWHLLGNNSNKIFINGTSQISLGEDYGDIEEIKKALEWYVDQFNGKIKWKK